MNHQVQFQFGSTEECFCSIWTDWNFCFHNYPLFPAKITLHNKKTREVSFVKVQYQSSSISSPFSHNPNRLPFSHSRSQVPTPISPNLIFFVYFFYFYLKFSVSWNPIVSLFITLFSIKGLLWNLPEVDLLQRIYESEFSGTLTEISLFCFM